MQHFIQQGKINTILTLSNPTLDAIDANVIVYYELDLGKKNFNVTIPAEDTIVEDFNMNIEAENFTSASVYISEIQ